jgi:phosphoglycolate phosphatase-like HAD superfamily hydrolase
MFRDFKYLDVDFDYSGLTDLNILFKIAELNNISFDLFQKAIDSIWENLYVEFQANCNQYTIHLIEGAKEFIQSLSRCEDVVLGLLTGNFRKCAYLKLSIVSLDKFFPFGAFGDDSINRTDLPRIAFERAESFYQVYFIPENTVIIGDSVWDIQTAKRNGIKSIAVATGKTDFETLAKAEADLLVPNLLDVEKLESFIRQ